VTAPTTPQPAFNYDPTVLSEAQVLLDMSPAPRPAETQADATDRAHRAAVDFERRVFERYDRLPEHPPRFNIAENDRIYGNLRPHGPHTLDHHGPQTPLERSPVQDLRTIEGRIYGDSPWRHAQNWSTRWIDTATMQRVIRTHVQEHWDTIRSDLAVDTYYEASFNAGHLVGEGYMNRGYGGSGPPAAEYFRTNLVRIVIRLAPGTDPPEPYVVTAFPIGAMQTS
jgi:hypothetical protein